MKEELLGEQLNKDVNEEIIAQKPGALSYFGAHKHNPVTSYKKTKKKGFKSIPYEERNIRIELEKGNYIKISGKEIILAREDHLKYLSEINSTLEPLEEELKQLVREKFQIENTIFMPTEGMTSEELELHRAKVLHLKDKLTEIKIRIPALKRSIEQLNELKVPLEKSYEDINKNPNPFKKKKLRHPKRKHKQFLQRSECSVNRNRINDFIEDDYDEPLYEKIIKHGERIKKHA